MALGILVKSTILIMQKTFQQSTDQAWIDTAVGGDTITRSN
jgi:hypothetical protein